MHPLFESPKLDRDLKSLIRENFREFCTSNLNEINNPPMDIVLSHQYHGPDDARFLNQHTDIGNAIDSMDPSKNFMQIKSETAAVTVADSEMETDAKFSDDDEAVTQQPVKNEETDDDDDLPLSKVRLKEKPVPDKVELPASIQMSFDKLCTAKTSSAFDSFLMDLKTCTALDTEQETYIVSNVVDLIKTTLPEPNIFPESKNDEKMLAQSISYPMFSLFKIMYQYEDKLKKCIQNVLKSIFKKLENGAGYMLLYFLKVHTRIAARKGSNATNVTFKTNLYKIFCDYVEENVDNSLIKDLNELESESPQMFLWLLPDVYREFKANMLNNSDVLKILVGCIDAKSLRDLIYSVTQGKLVLFKNDGVINCVRDSLDYETFEQYCLWQLVQAHDVPIDCLQVSFFTFIFSLTNNLN